MIADNSTNKIIMNKFEILKKYWGYDSFRPLQEEAIESILQGRDAITVLPTGGGKSLCFQVPAMALDGVTLVVSPLISLMKDQVDALNDCGIFAARLDSSLSYEDQQEVFQQIYKQELKLLYLAPERLLSDRFLETLSNINISFIAIDEAHCVSIWGHDFRPEYRQLGQLRKLFPDIPIGAYTATATEQVRDDIAQQLKLKDPNMLIGSFDRPNLIYKVQSRKTVISQVMEVLERHPNESGVIYCIRRKDVESLCKQLKKNGIKAAPYHAGMADEKRKKHQDQFIKEKVDVIVATIAFGMGIDKSNVRFIIHTGMPKSLEHYQQESGRAGRDGLEAECTLLFGGGDYGIWKSFMNELGDKAKDIAMEKLNSIYQFCNSGQCKHQAILKYFGQELDKDNCQACDVCLGEVETINDSLTISQKILSCIIRLDQQFGASYTAMVLVGSKDKRIMEYQHDLLSTYGLLSDYPKQTVHDWTEQLVSQGYIKKVGEYNILFLTETGVEVLKGNQTPKLLKPKEKSKERKVSKIAAASWENVDKDLFDILRKHRANLASEKNVPPFIIFADTSLRDMARLKPTTKKEFLQVHGVGEKKCQQYGKEMLEAIKEYIS